MTARRTPSAPQPPHPGASSAAGGSPPPAANGDFSQSDERMWALIGFIALGAAIAGLFLLVAWQPFVWLMVTVLTS